MVLVLAMALSMAVTVSAAGASGYSDADEITYYEAVDVFTALGFLSGMPDGSFDPTGLVTREQAAKIICYMLIGYDNAEALAMVTAESRFTDVEVDRWSAPYIEYCASLGIINGIGNDMFNPTGNVTAIEFAKMLLCAIGYGQLDEYVGKNWAMSVIADAQSVGILTLALDYTAAATREQVAQYGFNGFTDERCYQVALSKDTSSYIAQYTTANNQVGTLAYQQGVEASDTYVVNGISYYCWLKNGSALTDGYAIDDIIGTSTDGTELGYLTEPTSPYFIAEVEDPVVTGPYTPPTGGTEYYINGSEVQIWGMSDVYTAVDTRGVIVTFVNTDADAAAEKVLITEKTVGMVTGAVTVSGNYVKIPGIDTFHTSYVDYPADLGAYDVVLYYEDALGITHFEKAATVEGTATGITSGGNLVFNGSTYKVSELDGAVDDFDDYYYYNAAATLYLDDNGSVVYFFCGDPATAYNYCVLLAVAQSGFYLNGLMLMTDGTLTTAVIANIDGTVYNESAFSGSPPTYELETFFAYVENADGSYSLTDLPATGNVYSTAITGDPTISNVAQFDGTNIGNANTVFLVDNADAYSSGGSGYSVYTGVANIPTIPDADGEMIIFGNVAAFVYVSDGAADPTTAVYPVYFINENVYTHVAATATAPEYYEYDAIVGGVVTTVKVLAGVQGDVETGLFDVEYNSAGYITDPDDAIPTGTGYGVYTDTNGILSPASGGVFITGSAVAFTYDANTVVYYISEYGVVTIGTPADLVYDTDDDVTVYLTPSTTDADDLAAEVYVQVD